MPKRVVEEADGL